MSEFSLQLNEDQQQIQKWVHDFAENVVRPAAEEWDEKEEFPWPVVEEAARNGLYGFDFMANALTDPTGLTLPVAMEELFWGDAGIGLAIFGSGLAAAGISGNGTPEQIMEWVPQCYGTADVGLIAYETPPREGLVIDEGVLVEIVRPGTGDPVPAGEVGEDVGGRGPLLSFQLGPPTRAKRPPPPNAAPRVRHRPRARNPVTNPLGQAAGSAGSNRTTPPWLCTSISQMATAPPKLPSTWNGSRRN